METNERMVRYYAEVAAQHRAGFFFGDPWTVTKRRRFVSRFGIDPWLVAMIWNIIIIQANFPVGATVINLLWTLNFLKTYDKESNIAGFFGVDEKTYRNWNWTMLQCLATMNVVSF